MRRLLGVLLLCSSVAFVAAAPPSPSPAPKPVASATPFSSNAPAVVIYPFDASGDLQSNVGGGVAQIISQEFVVSGGLTVLPVGVGVSRVNYLQHARDVHADYYVSGYITPIGNGASVVEQVVSVDSGVIVYSQTTQIYSVPDIASQALTTHDVILKLAGRDINIGSQSQSTPEPSATNGASVSLGGLGSVLQGIFHRSPKPGATAVPAIAAHTKPLRAIIVTHVTGSEAATQTLRGSLDRYFKTATSTNEASTVAKSADVVCGSSRNNTIAAGTLATDREGGHYSAHTVNIFTLSVYTCFGAQLFTTTARDANLSKAIDAAVTAYATDHPDNS